MYLCTGFERKMRYSLSILFCLLVLSVSAQELIRKTDLQTAQEEFFDPAGKKKAEPYHFSIQYRAEAGYVQNNHRSASTTYPNVFLHGFRVGGTVDFMLPHRFSVQTGLLYTFTAGRNTQYWTATSYEDFISPDPQTGLVHDATIGHRLYEHQLTIPARVYLNIKLWKQLNLFFYTGPQLQIGLQLEDNIAANISAPTKEWLNTMGQPTESYDRYQYELYRPAIQWGLGGGMEWDRYRVQAGYDFGLNNMVRHKVISDQQMQEWHWFVSFCYRINK